MPMYTKLVFLAAKTVWRLPPAQRRLVLSVAAKQARKHGPTIARQVGTAVWAARKPR